MSADVTPLTLPGIDVTAVGADTYDLAPAEALAALRTLRPIGAAWRWIVGDLVLALCDHDTTQLHVAWQQLVGMDVDDRPSLMRSVVVAARFPIERRRATLSWSHHQEVAALPPGEADGWLDAAVEAGWSCHVLHERIEAARAQGEQGRLPGTTSWRQEHASTLRAVERAFGDGARTVLLHADGRWEHVEQATSPPIDATGGPS